MPVSMMATLTPAPRMPAACTAAAPIRLTPHALSYSGSPVAAAASTAGSMAVRVGSSSTRRTGLPGELLHLASRQHRRNPIDEGEASTDLATVLLDRPLRGTTRLGVQGDDDLDPVRSCRIPGYCRAGRPGQQGACDQRAQNKDKPRSTCRSPHHRPSIRSRPPPLRVPTVRSLGRPDNRESTAWRARATVDRSGHRGHPKYDGPVMSAAVQP